MNVKKMPTMLVLCAAVSVLTFSGCSSSETAPVEVSSSAAEPVEEVEPLDDFVSETPSTSEETGGSDSVEADESAGVPVEEMFDASDAETPEQLMDKRQKAEKEYADEIAGKFLPKGSTVRYAEIIGGDFGEVISTDPETGEQKSLGAPYRYVVIATVPGQPEQFFESYTSRVGREGWETFYPGGGQVQDASIIPQGNAYIFAPTTDGEIASGTGGLGGGQVFYNVISAKSPDKEFTETLPLSFRVLTGAMNVEHPAFDSGSMITPVRDTLTEIENGESVVVLDFILTPKGLEKESQGYGW